LHQKILKGGHIVGKVHDIGRVHVGGAVIHVVGVAVGRVVEVVVIHAVGHVVAAAVDHPAVAVALSHVADLVVDPQPNPYPNPSDLRCSKLFTLTMRKNIGS
jgi:hypothetical protein